MSNVICCRGDADRISIYTVCCVYDVLLRRGHGVEIQMATDRIISPIASAKPTPVFIDIAKEKRQTDGWGYSYYYYVVVVTDCNVTLA